MSMTKLLLSSAVVVGVFACGPAEEPQLSEFPDSQVAAANADDQAVAFDATTEQAATAAPFNINGTVVASSVKAVVIAEKLFKPTAMAFKPGDGSLWILNRGDDTTVVVDNPGKSTAKAAKFYDDSNHFMNNPTGIAFSPTKAEFAVSLDSINDYNGRAAGNYFTGPTLFTSDRRYFEGGTNSHYDMLHHSPKAMGIAVGARPATGQADMREYWVFNGNSGSVDRYFFNRPHQLGGDDHSDGITVRYATGQLKRVAEAPSHLAFDVATRQLYLADTGSGRVVRLDTRTSLSTARRIPAYHAETPLYEVPGTKVETVATGLGKPSGLLLVNGQLVVGEYATGHVKVLSTTGVVKGDLDTGLGASALAGLAQGPDGKLYVLDGRGGRALRLDLQ